VTEAERNQLSSRLNAAFSEGALAQDDYQARLDRLFAAQKLGELIPVVEGLPPLQTYNSPALVASTGGQPGELAEAGASSGLTLLTVGAVAGIIILIAILFLFLV
jgi:DUF1707 SHOCT-like domain